MVWLITEQLTKCLKCPLKLEKWPFCTIWTQALKLSYYKQHSPTTLTNFSHQYGHLNVCNGINYLFNITRSTLTSERKVMSTIVKKCTSNFTQGWQTRASRKINNLERGYIFHSHNDTKWKGVHDKETWQ